MITFHLKLASPNFLQPWCHYHPSKNLTQLCSQISNPSVLFCHNRREEVCWTFFELYIHCRTQWVRKIKHFGGLAILFLQLTCHTTSSRYKRIYSPLRTLNVQRTLPKVEKDFGWGSVYPSKWVGVSYFSKPTCKQYWDFCYKFWQSRKKSLPNVLDKQRN